MLPAQGLPICWPQFEACRFEHCNFTNLDFEASQSVRCTFVGLLKNIRFLAGYSHPDLEREHGWSGSWKSLGVDFSEACCRAWASRTGLSCPPRACQWTQNISGLIGSLDRLRAVEAASTQSGPEARRAVDEFVQAFNQATRPSANISSIVMTSSPGSGRWWPKTYFDSSEIPPRHDGPTAAPRSYVVVLVPAWS